MHKRVILVIAAAATLLVGSTSATRAGIGSPAAGPSGSVTLAIPTDPGNLDPQLTLVAAARFVDSFAYDTLVSLAGPGKVTSALAQS